jgi:hypothetical protein
MNNSDIFNIIISKLKRLPKFQSDNYFWLEYNNLDHDNLGIPKPDIFKLNYKNMFIDKTWYEYLELIFDYYTYEELIKTLQNKKIKKLTKQIYEKLQKTDNKFPLYPFEYYRKSGWISFSKLCIDDNNVFIL